MESRKSSESLVEKFQQVAPTDPDVERRKMFGYPCAFLGGNMFMGLYQESMNLRLGEADRQEFLQLPGAATFEPMAGRPMKEYVVVPPQVLSDPAALQRWIDRSLAYARSLPPKERTAKKKAAPRKK